MTELVAVDDDYEESYQLNFEGTPVVGQRLTVQAFSVLPNKPLKLFEEVTLSEIKGTVIGIDHKGKREGDGSAERRYVVVVHSVEGMELG